MVWRYVGQMHFHQIWVNPLDSFRVNGLGRRMDARAMTVALPW